MKVHITAGVILVEGATRPEQRWLSQLGFHRQRHTSQWKAPDTGYRRHALESHRRTIGVIHDKTGAK